MEFKAEDVGVSFAMGNVRCFISLHRWGLVGAGNDGDGVMGGPVRGGEDIRKGEEEDSVSM